MLAFALLLLNHYDQFCGPKRIPGSDGDTPERISKANSQLQSRRNLSTETSLI